MPVQLSLVLLGRVNAWHISNSPQHLSTTQENKYGFPCVSFHCKMSHVSSFIFSMTHSMLKRSLIPQQSDLSSHYPCKSTSHSTCLCLSLCLPVLLNVYTFVLYLMLTHKPNNVCYLIPCLILQYCCDVTWRAEQNCGVCAMLKRQARCD